MMTCWLSQTILSSRIDENTALPEWVSNHVRACRKCRGFSASSMSLAEQLSSSSNMERKAAPPFLHAKIISRLRAAERPERQHGRARLAWTAAVGLACLLMAGLAGLRQPSRPVRVASNSVRTPTELALKVNLPSVAQLDHWTKSLDAPLEQETKLVLLDARTALDTLARGFVPEDFLAPSSETERP